MTVANEPAAPYGLFQAFGVELEYMIVDRADLDVKPLADELLRDVAGEFVSEVEMGSIAWSNELALHVVELKTNGPARSLACLPADFLDNVRHINRLLAPRNGRLLPTAMHPWMDPHRELKLWPHEYNAVYEAYDRIFDCRGHGWANLQSVHLNLPFANDEEFGRLHAAVRLLMPLMPALAASSPVMERQFTGWLDTRMRVYRTNSARVPSITGAVIPEPIFSRDEYDAQVFARIHRDIQPLDPSGVLRGEWMNARGAIARFDRGAIEVRVLDVQETPMADLAICSFLVNVLRVLTGEHWTSTAEQRAFDTVGLAELLWRVCQQGEQAVVSDADLLRQFGISAGKATAGEVWQHLGEDPALPTVAGAEQPLTQALRTILDHGPLARRIERAVVGRRRSLRDVYAELGDCLESGRMFEVAD